MGIIIIIILVLYFIGSLISVIDDCEYKRNKRKAARYAVQKHENEQKSLQDAEIEKLEKEAEILRLKKEIEELKSKSTIAE